MGSFLSIQRLLETMDAVYWAPGPNDRFGTRTYPTPGIQIKVRWIDKNEQFIDFEGVVQTSTAVVFVDRDLELGGFLFLGVLADAPPDPKRSRKAIEIRSFQSTPDFRAIRFIRKVFL